MNSISNLVPMGSSRMRRAALLVGVVCLLAAGYMYMMRTMSDRAGPDVFPPISIATIDGRSFDAEAVQGRPLLVTFWSTTCLVCLKEMPDLESLYRRFSPRGFEIIAVSMPWDPPDEVVRLARARELPYPVALDVTGAVARAFGDVSVTPTHVLIDPRGDVAFHRAGALDFAALDERLQAMF